MTWGAREQIEVLHATSLSEQQKSTRAGLSGIGYRIAFLTTLDGGADSEVQTHVTAVIKLPQAAALAVASGSLYLDLDVSRGCSRVAQLHPLRRALAHGPAVRHRLRASQFVRAALVTPVQKSQRRQRLPMQRRVRAVAHRPLSPRPLGSL